MPINNSTGLATAAKVLNTVSGESTGVVRAEDFAVCDNVNAKTQLKIDVSNVTPDSTVTLAAPSSSGTIAREGEVNIQYSAPLTEATVVLASTTTNLIINPAGTIAELTIALPAASDGKKFTVSSSQIVTALTLTAAGDDTIKNDVTAMAAGGSFTFIARSGVWYRG